MWTGAKRAARGGKFKVESGHGGTPPCVTESVWIRLKAEGLRRHGRVELCRVCRVRGSGERRRAGGSVWGKGDGGRVRGEDEVAGRGWRLRIMLDGSMKVTKCQ